MKLFVVCFVLFFINLVQAETGLSDKKEEVVVLVPEVEGWTGEHTSDKNHHFVKYLQNNVTLFDIEVKCMPAARAIALFSQMESGCFLGVDPLTLSLYVDHKLQFFRLMDSPLYAMTLKNSKLDKVTNETSLAVIRGFDSEDDIPTLKDQIIAEYNDVNQAIKMLERNRVDAFLYWDILPDDLAQKLKKVEDTPLRTDEAGLNCIDNTQGNELLTYLSNYYPHPNHSNTRIVDSADNSKFRQ